MNEKERGEFCKLLGDESGKEALVLGLALDPFQGALNELIEPDEKGNRLVGGFRDKHWWTRLLHNRRVIINVYELPNRNYSIVRLQDSKTLYVNTYDQVLAVINKIFKGDPLKAPIWDSRFSLPPEELPYRH